MPVESFFASNYGRLNLNEFSKHARDRIKRFPYKKMVKNMKKLTRILIVLLFRGRDDQLSIFEFKDKDRIRYLFHTVFVRAV